MSETVILPVEKNQDDNFGKYQFVSELGDGAMGTVYKCFDPDFHRMVAIKTVHKDLLSDHSTDEFRERFRNEMRAAGKLTHPNIVSVFDAGEKDHCPFYVMEFVEGQDLKNMIDQNTPFSLKQSLSIIKCVLRGLSNIHKNGITHRDLKPANIFVSNADGIAKIADFGIAKLDNSEMTQIGTIIGSPKYMSPEQCVGEPVDTRTDLFATGIILYELLTGTYCYKAESTSAMTQKIINVEIVPPSKVNPEIPKYLDKVLLKALSKKADDRFQNALEFLNAIDEGKNKSKKNPSWGKKLGIASGVTISALSIVVLTQLFSPSVTLDSSSNGQIQPTSQSEFPVDNKSIAPSNVEIKQLSPEKTAKIAKLFKVAETYQRIGRLVSPSGSNAYDAYKIVLTLDPSNQKALTGLESIKALLIENMMEASSSGDSEYAISVAKAGQEVYPGTPAFSELIKNTELSEN